MTQNNTLTLDGKQYTVSDETTYTMEPGKLYRDTVGDTVRINPGGSTACQRNCWQNGDGVVFPLRELIPVEEEMPPRQAGKTDAVIKDLQAQLDAMTKRAESAERERDELREVCMCAYHYLIGVDSVRVEEDRKPLTESRYIKALNVDLTVREVPKP